MSAYGGQRVGGTFEKCAIMAKQALTRSVDQRSEIPYVREMEEELLEKINRWGRGPGAGRIRLLPSILIHIRLILRVCP